MAPAPHLDFWTPSPLSRLPESSQLEELFSAMEKRQARQFVLKRLAIKSYATAELRQKLEERLVSAEVIEAVIDEFEQLGYLNDREWIAAFLRQKSREGPRLLAAKLRAKGLPEEMIFEALASHKNPAEEQNQLLSLLKTRYRTKNLTDFKEKQKVIASLARKGFDISSIKQAIDACINR